MLTAEDRAIFWAEMDEEERSAMIADHVMLFQEHVMHRRAQRIRIGHRRQEPAFPVGDPVPLPDEAQRSKWARRIYGVLAEASTWLTRNEIGEALGLGRARNWHGGLKVLDECGVIVHGPQRMNGYRKRGTVALRRR